MRNNISFLVVFSPINNTNGPFTRNKNTLLNSLRASSPGCLEVGREKEGDLATTSLEFEYLHRKSRCEMLIGGNDISNDVITRGAHLLSCVFHV